MTQARQAFKYLKALKKPTDSVQEMNNFLINKGFSLADRYVAIRAFVEGKVCE